MLNHLRYYSLRVRVCSAHIWYNNTTTIYSLIIDTHKAGLAYNFNFKIDILPLHGAAVCYETVWLVCSISDV